MIKNKKQSMIVIGAFIFILMLFTTTYAFFNYTRTGTSNVIKTGRIYFNADGGNNTVTLSDLFPISVGENETITSSTPGVGSLKLHITGDTTYTEGIEYLIEAVEVTGNGQTTLPISIDISYATTAAEQGQDPNVIGTSDNDYFTNRGGNTSRYKLLSNGSVSEGEDILVGYIAPGVTGIDGELTILAYLNADNIAITDTYDEDEPETDLNGTTTDWIDGRTIFTTEEWNALQATGVSFKIKVTANEGIWVEEPRELICRRATQLHTVTCNQTGSNGCAATVGNGNPINYGNLGTSGEEPESGDAYDCDVNNDGVFDWESERFYYITSYENSSVLIYYTNVNGITPVGNGTNDQILGNVKYHDQNKNWYGPVTAFVQLPSTEDWSNPKLILPEENRQIVNEAGTTSNAFDTDVHTIEPFTYTNKAARMLTYQEVQSACGNNITSSSSLNNCAYLFENVGQYERSGYVGTVGYLLETPRSTATTSVWYVNGTMRFVDKDSADISQSGIRPVIEVLNSNME